MKLNSTTILLLASFLSFSALVPAMDLVPGHIYTTEASSSDILHFDQNGGFVDSFSVPSQFGSTLRGLNFGADGLLNVVSIPSDRSGFNIVSLDRFGSLQTKFTGSTYVFGSDSYGKLSIDNGRYFVAGQDELISFTSGNPNSSVIYSANQVFDSKALPNGNLLVLSAYELKEITPTGSIVRTINSSTRLVDARGIEYDSGTDTIYVTMLGDSDGFFRVLKLNGTTGNVSGSETFTYGDDLVMIGADRLLVGSNSEAPGIFDLSLNRVGTLGTQTQNFVAYMPVPEPASMFAIGVGVVGYLSKRRKK